jgi:nucleoside-diphosphate-sugar epimerase
MVNLIHVDDAANVIIAAERHSRPPRTYIVSDGHPVQRREFFSYLAKVSGLASPQFCEPIEGDESGRSRGGNKRVSNARMLADLGVQLAYPTFREGLAAAVQ